MKYTISHVSTCLPDYFGGHHLPWFSIAITNTTLYDGVKKEMLDWQTTDHLESIDASSEAFKLAVEELFTDVKLEQPVDDKLDDMDEDDCYDYVTMFFVIERSELTYEELTPVAKQRALEDWAEDRPYEGWWDMEEENLIEDMKLRGIEIDDVQFSGFSSQGDGASFVGNIDLLHFMNWEAQEHPDNSLAVNYPHIYTSQIPFNGEVDYEWMVSIQRNSHHYSHENTVGVELTYNHIGYDEDDTIPQHEFEGLEQALNDVCREYMRSYYKDLKSTYDFLTSEEYFIESCDANSWVFDEDGDLTN